MLAWRTLQTKLEVTAVVETRGDTVAMKEVTPAVVTETTTVELPLLLFP